MMHMGELRSFASSNFWQRPCRDWTVFRSVLRCVVMCCGVAVCCGALRCVAVCGGVLRCVVACCSVLQCVAVCCSVLQ